MIGEEIETLIQRYRMRKNTSNIAEWHSRRGDQIMHNANACFGYDRQIVVEQMIVILVYGARQCIFDGNNRRLHLLLSEIAKQLFKALARQDIHASAEQRPRRFFAERAPFSLKCCSFHSHSRGYFTSLASARHQSNPRRSFNDTAMTGLGLC